MHPIHESRYPSKGFGVVWLTFALSFMAAAVLLAIPGTLFARAFGLRASVALPIAPVVSVALYGVLAIIYGMMGVSASPASLLLPPVIVGILLALLLQDWRKSGRRLRLLDTSERADTRISPRVPISWSTASLVVSVVAALTVSFFVLLVNVGSPDSFLNNYDIAFHLSRVREFVDGGNYSSLSGGFYPSAWHCVAAMVCSITGCSIPSVVLASILAFIVIAYPMGTCYLLATLFPDRPRRVFLGSLFCLCVAFFPWRIMLFGPLYPNIASFSLMPAVAALFIRLLWPRGCGEGRVLCAGLFVTGGIALTLSQPNTVFFAALCLVPYCMHRIRVATSRSHLGEGRPWVGVTLEVAFLALFVIAWVIVLSTPYLEPLVAYERATPVGIVKAINRLLTFQFVIWRPQYLLFAISMLGALVLLVKDKARWFVASYAVLGAVYVVSISASGPLRGYISGFCYNDYYRTAAAVCVFVIPLVATGLDAIISGIEAISAKVRTRTGRPASPAPVIVASTVAVFLVIGFNYFPLFDIPRFASWGFDAVAYEIRESYTNEGNHYYRADEEAFANRVKEIVGDARVANQPYDGSVFSYACNDVHVLFSAFGPSTDEDERLVMSGLDRVESDARVRDAVERLDIRYVLQLDQGSGPTGMNPAGTVYDLGYEKREWVGINGIRDDTPGFTLLLSEGDMRLYEIDR